MLKKLVALSFGAAAFVGLVAGTASAGEVTGNGKGGYQGTGQPAATLKGHASECAFSGRNDDRTSSTQVQNFGHRNDDPFFLEFLDTSHGASEVTVIIDLPPPPDGPGPIPVTIGCNKHAGGDAGA